MDLPDELVRRVKTRAAARHQTLEDTVAQLLEVGLANTTGSVAKRRAPRPVRLKGGPLTIEDIESAISAKHE